MEHRSVTEIVQSMTRLEHKDDWELAHILADRLLIEALQSVSVHIEKEPIRSLIEAYGKVGKWYT